MDLIYVEHRSWRAALHSFPPVILASFTEAHIQHVSCDPMGRVIAGHINLVCHIRPARARTTKLGAPNQVIKNERFNAGALVVI